MPIRKRPGRVGGRGLTLATRQHGDPLEVFVATDLASSPVTRVKKGPARTVATCAAVVWSGVELTRPVNWLAW